MTGDVFTEHYRILATDEAARAALLADPEAGLAAHFGSLPAGDYRVEVVEERADVITILLPAPPADGAVEDRLSDVDGRVYDILHTVGVGGYLIPDDRLTWVLRDLRARWAADGGAGSPTTPL